MLLAFRHQRLQKSIGLHKDRGVVVNGDSSTSSQSPSRQRGRHDSVTRQTSWLSKSASINEGCWGATFMVWSIALRRRKGRTNILNPLIPARHINDRHAHTHLGCLRASKACTDERLLAPELETRRENVLQGQRVPADRKTHSQRSISVARRRRPALKRGVLQEDTLCLP